MSSRCPEGLAGSGDEVGKTATPRVRRELTAQVAEQLSTEARPLLHFASSLRDDSISRHCERRSPEAIPMHADQRDRHVLATPVLPM